MAPSIIGGAWVISFRLGFRRRVPARFDVVRLEDPEIVGHWILKRIVGLPGEEVLLKDGELFIDGQVIDDTHAQYAQVSSHLERLRVSNLSFVTGPACPSRTVVTGRNAATLLAYSGFPKTLCTSGVAVKVATFGPVKPFCLFLTLLT